MKKVITPALIFLIFSIQCYSQNLSQTIRGTVLDIDSKTPLIGASIVIIGTMPLVGTMTNGRGEFRIENVPVGRVSLKLTYMGYEEKIVPNILVNSGKEVVLNLEMQESVIKMEEVVIKADRQPKGEALNDMALVSARSVSPDQITRFPGSFNDPSRIVSNFAGVTNTQDGSNDIIIRGNSPKYMQWRLDGIPITTPNHFSNQSAAGGSISILNNNVLSSSDFYTGAFPAEYGNVLSGVYDIKLRNGNNQKLESVFGFGLLGTDLTLEGPFKKGYDGSFIVNYRYSTASIISAIGLVEIVGIPRFQDASFKVVLPTNKLGTFSIFGLGGYSGFVFDDVKPDIWVTPGDRAMSGDLREEYKKRSHALNFGLNHTLNLDKNSFVNTFLMYSDEGVADHVYEHGAVKIYNEEGQYLKDSTFEKVENFRSKMVKATYRAGLDYTNKINSKNKIQVGTQYTVFGYELRQSHFLFNPEERFYLVDFDESIGAIQNFVSWKYRFNEDWTLVSGIHNMNVLYNKKSTIEPRVAINWQPGARSIFSAGYGNHSMMESVHHYFARVEQPDGSVTEPNKDLGLLRANHYVVGYEYRLAPNVRLKLEAYCQDLYNLPVENNDSSSFSTINEGLEFTYVELVNKGTGRNMGLELTLERFLSKNYYYLINGSLFNSTYKALDGVERNTAYNNNFLINVLVGKEFVHLGKKRNQTLGLNARVFYGGGQRIIPLLRNSNGELAVNPEENKYWDYEKAYEVQLENIYRIVISASYKFNRPKATHEIFINLDNLTDVRGKIQEYYDTSQPGNIGYLTQFGFFPNLMYRVYF